MKLTRALALVLVVVALAGLAGCDLFENPASIIGSIDVQWNSIDGGYAYHVVLYAYGTTMDPATNYATAAQAMAISGQFPGAGESVTYSTTNYEMDEVPAGTYTLFAWVDADNNGSFNPNSDGYGFYDGAGNWATSQPYPNVVVPDAGIVDIDVTVSNPVWGAF